jgi:hypothetical protein
MQAALAPPPPSSSERDRRLLDLSAEAGIGGHALSLLERIDVAHLCAHDRITYLRHVTACAAWFEAFQTIATAAVAGPTSGWPEAEVDEHVRREVTEAGGRDLSDAERQSLSARVRDEAWEVRERAIALEVSLATRVSPRTAGRRIDSARLLVEAMPRAVGEAWVGHWGYGHLRAMERELIDVPSPLREQVLDDVLPHAATDHPRRLTDRLRKSLAKRDAAGMAGRTRERSQERDVTVYALKDGQARLSITGPYEAVYQASRQVHALALARKQALREQGAGVSCSIGALRFDAAVSAIDRLYAVLGPSAIVHAGNGAVVHGGAGAVVHSGHGDDAGNLAEHPSAISPTIVVSGPTILDHPTATSGASRAGADPWRIPHAGTTGSRPRQQAAVIVDAATALHLADEPGYVPGYGWVPAPIAREILADADSWRRWMLDDSSRRIIDAGTVRYRPTAALRDLIAGRDVTCTADTCGRPASEAQVDHAVDFDGRNTTPANLHMVCGPDHLAVTAGHFMIDTDDDGRARWVSTASGHAYPSYVDPLHERGERPTAHE